MTDWYDLANCLGMNPDTFFPARGGHRKVSDEDAASMLAMARSGQSYRVIGDAFDVSPATVCRNLARLEHATDTTERIA